jgi:hypothetical protein
VPFAFYTWNPITRRADWNSTGGWYRTESIKQALGNGTEAKRRYEAAAKRFMLATIQATREERPGCVVGWYGYPRNNLPYIPTEAYRRWCKWPQNQGVCFWQGYDDPGTGDAQRRLDDELQWLFDALDVITPTVYLGLLPTETTSAANKAYVHSTVREAVRLLRKGQHWQHGREGKSRRAVMPYTWYMYNDYHLRPKGARKMLSVEDASIQFLEPLEAGADGVFVWGAVSADDHKDWANTTQTASALQAWVDTVLVEVLGSLTAAPTASPTTTPTATPTTTPTAAAPTAAAVGKSSDQLGRSDSEGAGGTIAGVPIVAVAVAGGAAVMLGGAAFGLRTRLSKAGKCKGDKAGVSAEEAKAKASAPVEEEEGGTAEDAGAKVLV